MPASVPGAARAAAPASSPSASPPAARVVVKSVSASGVRPTAAAAAAVGAVKGEAALHHLLLLAVTSTRGVHGVGLQQLACRITPDLNC